MSQLASPVNERRFKLDPAGSGGAGGQMERLRKRRQFYKGLLATQPRGKQCIQEVADLASVWRRSCLGEVRLVPPDKQYGGEGGALRRRGSGGGALCRDEEPVHPLAASWSAAALPNASGVAEMQ